MRILFLALAFVLGQTQLIYSQKPKKPSSSEIYHNLQKLNFLGSALYLAAHPDDENTRLISYLSNDVHARTAYLSLTRGDGGQNLIGPEIRELLGVIRTEELLAARGIDGGKQFFTRANDFGYSKHPEETLEIWNKEEVLKDVVKTIRKFKPDIIINRFDHRSPGTTHGHHTSSAMLSVEAFDLVNNASVYPKSAEQYGPWQPKRLFFNTSWWFYGSQEKFQKADKSNLVSVETGNYYPSLGLSNGEIAALSRSMHKSQGFGSTGSRGSETEYLELLKGDLPKDGDLFEGINTTWSRIDGGNAIGNILNALEKDFNFKNPSEMLPQLLKAYGLLNNLKDTYWKEIKKKELKQLILDCGGIYLEAVSNVNSINPKGTYTINFEAVNREASSVVLQSVTTLNAKNINVQASALTPNEPVLFSEEITSNSTVASTPYWLKEKGSLGMYNATDSLIGLPETPAPEKVIFNLKFGETVIPFEKTVVYKFNDPVKGEVYQPLEVLPEITTSIADKVIIFPSGESKNVVVSVTSGIENSSGSLQLNHPDGWKVEPATQTFNLQQKGASQSFVFKVTPPENQSEGYLKPLAIMGDTFFDRELITIDYEHIPYQRVLLPSEAKVVRIDIEKKGKNIGYIEGAGDVVPESLRYIGYNVATVSPSEITSKNLSKYDAVVVGIRAYNTVPELAFKQNELNDYVKNGGTLIVQYNTNRGLVSDSYGPYSLNLSRDRVTDEFSEIQLLAPTHPVLNTPNKITQKDFENWVQERGLYFPDDWDKKFTPILGMHDKDEKEMKGALLVADYGKGHYVYTGLSFFRELPAGVAGAYRLFANLLSLGN